MKLSRLYQFFLLKNEILPFKFYSLKCFLDNRFRGPNLNLSILSHGRGGGSVVSEILYSNGGSQNRKGRHYNPSLWTGRPKTLLTSTVHVDGPGTRPGARREGSLTVTGEEGQDSHIWIL